MLIDCAWSDCKQIDCELIDCEPMSSELDCESTDCELNGWKLIDCKLVECKLIDCILIDCESEVGSLSVRPDGSKLENGPGLHAGHSNGEGGQGEAVSNGCKDVGGICATGKEGADEIDDEVCWLRRWWQISMCSRATLSI